MGQRRNSACFVNKFIRYRTYAFAPLAPQIWGELDLLPPRLGGWGGQNDGVCVSPEVV